VPDLFPFIIKFFSQSENILDLGLRSLDYPYRIKYNKVGFTENNP
jgi:hypothetical protein